MVYGSELRDGVRIIRCEGHWTGGRDDDPLREAVKGWIAEGERLFIMDLSQVDLLNSIGLGSLVGYYSSLAREGGQIKLAGMRERHRRAAYVARILDLFEEFETTDLALERYRKEGLV